jgi:DnaJ homolog subfamily C member 9
LLGSEEELADLKTAYLETSGSVDEIISHIPHSNYSDEHRFVEAINGLITKGSLEALPAWTKGLKDAKGRASRKRKGEQEAQEAEGMAKELGVWDEFYGNGKEGKRRGKGKGKNTNDGEGAADGEAALKALIQSRQKKLGGIFDGLAAKYGTQDESKSRGKKRAAAEPDIDEEEFTRIQQKLNQSSTKRSKSKRAK